MAFSKKKKTERDREAGLMFRWRGGNQTNRGGGILALCLTAAIFAGGFLLLNVSAKPNIVPSRYRASVIQLTKVDDRLAWWIEKNSPPIPQWSTSADAESVDRVDELLLSEINATKHKGIGYQDIYIPKISRVEDEVFSLNADTLPDISRHTLEIEGGIVAQPDFKVRWDLEISPKGGLKGRWPKELTYEGLVPEAWRGSSVKYSVAVNPTGKVLAVDPMEWSEDPMTKTFQDWLYAVTFTPDNKSDASALIGIIEFSSVSRVESLEEEVQP